jgi:DNA modification methylase
MTYVLLKGDWVEMLRTLPAQSVQCCITSPPYYGLRDYGTEGQLGLDATPASYVARMVEGFREVRRVLRDDGTLWLNLGDSYGGGHGGNATQSAKQRSNQGTQMAPRSGNAPKQLLGIPWRVAFALQDDGWVLRQDIIWHKPNPMPESVTDRCTKAHEYLFLFAKQTRYYYDHEAVKEKAHFRATDSWEKRKEAGAGAGSLLNGHNASIAKGVGFTHTLGNGDARNRRSVWSIATQPYAGAHFAVMPPALVAPCILAGCPEGGTVLDPFVGSGTVVAEAVRRNRHGIGIDLNPAYLTLAQSRIEQAVQPLWELL